MHQPLTFAILAILAVCALAAPTPIKALSKRPSFKVPVKPRNSIMRTPQQELARTYGKYGWQIVVVNPQNPWAGIWGGGASSSSAPAPAATSSAASTDGSDVVVTVTQTLSSPAAATSTTAATAASSGETGDVTATPETNESEYLEAVNIGGQTLNLDFDTGSADLWVFSTSLPSSESSGHTTFDPSKSSSFSDYQGASWQISYGDGSSASGTVGFDTVNIGGATVTRQAVELATDVSGSFVEDTSNDGLVGLGFSKINTVEPQQQQTFFENIKDDLAQPLFTANLEDGAAGTYTFGEIDQSQYSGSIHYTPVNTVQGFWQFDSNSYKVGGTTNPCTTCSPAIADTGTSLLLVDDDIASAYYNQVGSAQYDESQGGYIYDCNADLPDFGVEVGGYMVTLTGSQQITFSPLGDGTCFGGIQGNQGQGLQIFGDTFLKNVFAVFDASGPQFGVAAKA